MARRENEYAGANRSQFKSGAERRKGIGKNLSFGASEAYKLLRTNLVFSMAEESKCKIIGVTSALRHEGKSTTSINLAYTLAQSNKRVLLIEGDMRIPVFASTLRIGGKIGLSHVLAGMNSLNEAVHENVLLPKMYVITAGDMPPNPSELISSKRMERVLEALSTAFEYIIIDLPPVNAVSDGLAISRMLSGMLVVVRQDYCDHQSLAEAMQKMELLEVKVLGFVFNDADASGKRYKKYGKNYNKHYNKRYDHYSYGYGQKDYRSESAVNERVEFAPIGDIEIEKGAEDHV